MAMWCIWTFIGAEAVKTIVALSTTAVAGGVVWLVTLHRKSAKLRKLLSNPGRSFILHYRGEEDDTKTKNLHFLPCGRIEYPNGNEDFWEIRLGVLEIHSSGHKVFSKFKWNPKQGRLVHTNDPALPSAMGQYIVPSIIPAANQTGIYAKGK